MLEDAPRLTFASTHIRAALLRRESILEYVCQGVEEYIRSHSLYSPAEKMVQLGKAIEAEPSNTTLRMERAKLCMQQKLYRKAIDDLSEILRLEPQNHEAGMSLSVIEEILRK